MLNISIEARDKRALKKPTSLRRGLVANVPACDGLFCTQDDKYIHVEVSPQVAPKKKSVVLTSPSFLPEGVRSSRLPRIVVHLNRKGVGITPLTSSDLLRVTLDQTKRRR